MATAQSTSSSNCLLSLVYVGRDAPACFSVEDEHKQETSWLRL